MKLISMTDFVLEQTAKEFSAIKRLNQIIGYAEFLKQPLKLEMFVPCDDDGNILEEPKTIHTFASENSDEYIKKWKSGTEIYNKAKEKVLFEGFKIVEYSDKTIEIISDTAPNFIIPFKKLNKKNWEQRYSCIEDLLASIVDIELTQTALKQIQP